jgi:phage/plasmid primase-like uncharacterized protein
MNAAYELWVERARAVPIERELDRRGVQLDGKIEKCGPCPVCGGDDRFSINVKKRVWNCRQCGVGGDVIKLVEHLDGCEFIAACTTLTGEPPPPKAKKANGKDHASKTRKVVVAEYPYHDEKTATSRLLLIASNIKIPMAALSSKTASTKKPFVNGGPIQAKLITGYQIKTARLLCCIVCRKC